MKLYLLSGLLCTALLCHAQTNIRLKQGNIGFTPRSFHVQDVVDDRADKGTIAEMKSAGKSGSINLQGGAAASLKEFLTTCVTQDKSTQAVSMHITKLSFTIRKSGDEWDEQGEMTVAFHAGGRELVEYSARSMKKTDGPPLDFVDEFVRRSIENDLKKFDTWWTQNGSSVPVSKDVKVNAVIGRVSKKPENIVYSLQRPLQISDFQGPPEGNNIELAATLSGAGLETSEEVINGQLVVNVVVTPYFNKTQSWFKKEGMRPQVLAHEQAHFDITAIKACELLARIRNTAFTQDNYQEKLQELMTWNSSETGKAQEEYDRETNHGTLKEKQLEWEKKISQQVRSAGCF